MSALPNRKSDGKPELPACYECGKTFDPVKQKLRTSPDYNRTAQGVICKDRPSCRGRKLHAEFEKRGLKRWARHTQEQLLAQMDCPPPKWNPDEKWESIYDPPERVLAAIEFFSICYPVCLLYAVQTDEDGEPIKEMGEWKRHTHRSLGKVLGMDQPRVTRAVADLKRRHRITEDEARLCIEMQPKSLSRIERDACTRISGQILKDLGDDSEQLMNLKDLLALPPRTLRIIADLAPVVPSDVCTRIKEVALDACTRLNRDISDARTRASDAVLDVCKPHLSLLSRTRDTQKKRAVSPSEAIRPPKKPFRDEDRQIPEPQTPAATLSIDDPDMETMFSQVELMQVSYPHTDFSAEKLARDNAGDLKTISLIVQTIRRDVMGFCVFVAAKFKGLDKSALAKLPARAPGQPHGPRSLGLILTWAKDYANRQAAAAS